MLFFARPPPFSSVSLPTRRFPFPAGFHRVPSSPFATPPLRFPRALLSRLFVALNRRRASAEVYLSHNRRNHVIYTFPAPYGPTPGPKTNKEIKGKERGRVLDPFEIQTSDTSNKYSGEERERERDPATYEPEPQYCHGPFDSLFFPSSPRDDSRLSCDTGATSLTLCPTVTTVAGACWNSPL